MPTPSADEVYRGVTRAFSLVIMGFGAVILVATIAGGGKPTSLGILIGLIFLGLGAGRFYLSLRASN